MRMRRPSRRCFAAVSRSPRSEARAERGEHVEEEEAEVLPVLLDFIVKSLKERPPTLEGKKKIKSIELLSDAWSYIFGADKVVICSNPS